MNKILLLLTAWAIGMGISCNKDNNSSSNITTNTVNSIVISGSWRITYYWDSDHEETSNYAGYSFAFAGGNVLTANKSSTTVTGTWTTVKDDSKIKLVLAFTTPASFAKLSDDWHVFEQTSTRIRLQDVSGGGGGTDYLTFEKN